jgi:VanZ family protein
LITDRSSLRRRDFWQAWIPALVWLGVIAVESTSLLSSEHTSRFLYPVLHFLFNLDPLRFFVWHFYLRKTGHVLGYGILSVLLFRAWRVTLTAAGNPRWSMVWARTAWFMTALVASLDEWHQTFIPSRTGSIRDVALDSVAGLAGQVLLFVALRGWPGGNSRLPREPLVDSPSTTSADEPASTSVGS